MLNGLSENGILTEKKRIFLKISFNNYRDVSDSTENAVPDKEQMKECECVLWLPKGYSDTGFPTPLDPCKPRRRRTSV